MIRRVTEDDAEAICAIYNYYVENTVISFEDEIVSVDEMQTRIIVTTSEYPWFVYEHEGEVLAYAYAGLWKSRSAYRYTLEVTVYASATKTVSGVGTKLYEALLDELDNSLVRSVMAVIALPNDVSVGFHEKMGFEKAAHFKEVGFKHEQWIDVGYWQKVL